MGESRPLLFEVERIAGRRCDFVVRYHRDGERYIDGIWAETPAEAERIFRAGAAELGWKVSNVTVVVRV